MASCSSKKPAAFTRERRRKRDYKLKLQVFFIWAMLILIHMPLSSCKHHHNNHHHHHHPSSVSSSRKTMFFKAAQPQFHAASSQPPVGATGEEGDSVFDEDKRIIHTGPNPLHN
ncbi:hypothetical protein HanIR_Chr08g0348631 [Helianthus annuus]|nr:hypothetical protein HanIR_Chr08g0348631 [Helianthus annuus]